MIDSTVIVEKIIEVAIYVFIGMFLYRILDFKKLKENKKVKEQAYTDQLTGRGNRYKFNFVVDKLIVKDKKFAVCFMDLDGFKQINDTMGHDAGDKLLIALANTFDENLPKNATAYRLGGDEFAIIIENIKTTADVVKLLDDLREKFRTPINIDGTNIRLEYSLGIALYPEDAVNRKDLIMYADDAMYYIKEHGKNDYYFYNKALRAKVENDNKMQKDLKTAYEKGQFGIDLQPRINTKDTKEICFEALLYWNHPVLGKLPSSYFIKQADEIALTIKLDEYFLDLVCKELNKYKELGFDNIKMAMNISNRHASKRDFIDKLCEILNENMIEQGSIKIELTDTLETEKIEDYKVMFEKLKECGADIIINNLELKYEKLVLYKDLPIDEIKVGAHYMSKDSALNSEILKDIINLGRDLDYKVVVNCIEDEKTLIYAIRNGANSIQGDFLFKKMDTKFSVDFAKEYENYVNKIDGIIVKANGLKNNE